jgi:hypothetical protein
MKKIGGFILKKFAAFIVVIVVLYSVYFDIKVGTIPSVSFASEIQTHKEKPSEPAIPYQAIKVKPGDTVLSVVEQLQAESLQVSIDQVISDFIKLNNGIKPVEIQIGQIYKFPVYKNK